MKVRTTLAALWFMTVAPKGAFAQDIGSPSVSESIRDSLPLSYSAIADNYDPADVPELLDVLNSEDDEHYWPRVAGVLGVIGGEDQVDVLIELIEKPIVGPVYISQDQHDLRREAIRSLGFLAGRTGSDQALNYLIESLDDGIWRRRNVLGVIDYLDTYDSYDRQLTIYAIFGLALSGHPRAGEALRSVRQSPTQAQLRLSLDDVLDTWLPIHDLVADRGVVGMYEYRTAQHLEAEPESE